MSAVRHLCEVTAPDGAVSYICYAAPGKTPDPMQATAFISKGIAESAGRSLLFGDPRAFWESERRSAENTRRAHVGWTFRAVPVTDFPALAAQYEAAA